MENAIKHLQTHKFRPYQPAPIPQYGLDSAGEKTIIGYTEISNNVHKFGLNSFGSKSIISYTEVNGDTDLWMFIWFSTSSDRSAIYVNSQGIRRTFDLSDPNIASRATAMEECD